MYILGYRTHVPLDVQLFDGVVDVVCELDVGGRRTTALVVVCGDVRADGSERTQALSSDHFITYTTTYHCVGTNASRAKY